VNAARVGESAEYDRAVATGEMRSGVSDSGVAVLELEGEHDIYTAPKLRDRLGELVETGPGVVVDLSGASFVDSSILGALLNARQRAVDARKGFAVCLTSQSAAAVRRVFEMTGLSETLPVLPDLDRAIATAASGPPKANGAAGR
jgi:anti-sigma B factor antagonist